MFDMQAMICSFFAQLLIYIEDGDVGVQLLLWLTAGHHAAEGVPVIQ